LTLYNADFWQGKVKMRLSALVFLAVLTLFAPQARADQARADQAGEFDYYVMSLSWSPNWCATTGDARSDPQCDAGRGLTFTLHGLWPQYEQGYPADCFGQFADPSREDTAKMADIMGGAGLAFYEWKKHGRCAGIPARAYYQTMRQAYASITIPPVFAKINKDITIPALVIQDAFLESNPQLSANQVTIACKGNLIQEVRICLTKNLTPRDCAPDVVRDCTLPKAELDRVR
jgi:ribonuclease T2